MTDKTIFLLFMLCLLVCSAAAQDEDQVEEWFDRAERCTTRGQWSRAASYYEKVLGAEAGDEEAARGAVLCYVATGRYEKHDEMTGQWLEKKPDSLEWTTARVDFLVDVGRGEEALEVIHRRLESKGTDYLLEAIAGRIHANRGRVKEATASFDALVERARKEVVREARDLTGLAGAYRFFSARGKEAEQALAEAQKKDEKWLRGRKPMRAP